MGKKILNIEVYKVIDLIQGVDGLSLRYESIGKKDIKKVFLKKYKIDKTNERVIDIRKTNVMNIHKNDLVFDSDKLTRIEKR